MLAKKCKIDPMRFSAEVTGLNVTKDRDPEWPASENAELWG